MSHDYPLAADASILIRKFTATVKSHIDEELSPCTLMETLVGWLPPSSGRSRGSGFKSWRCSRR